MKKGRVNVSIVPDARRKKEGGKLPLKLRITYKGERRYYGTGFDANEEEWAAINSAGPRGELRRIKAGIAEIEKKAEDCIEKIVPFSFKQFEKAFFGKEIQFETLKLAFKAQIEQLESNDQWGTAAFYRTACNALHRFKAKIALEDVDQDFLRKFEKWILGEGLSITTVGIYLRALRTILNIAIDKGSFRKDAYPFGKRKYVIPTGKNIKKALAIDQIKKVFEYPTPSGSFLEQAKDFWILTYLCNGINMMDIARLKGKDIDAKSIRFIREKTKRTKRGDPLIITAARNPHVNAILAKWGKKSPAEEEYVFGIIEDSDTPKVARAKIQQFTKLVNKWMKRMGEDIGFNLTLTTYVARHSFATILLRSGAPMTFASQSLGHSNVITTQKYFAGFDLEAQAEYTKALVNF
ncbi:MAG TPA: site-specific integrase [Puia sp.]|uniref:site-specific integrase n=1 Tax=Puia sp. TaxID=2045100 RepID=UPI002BD0E59B|nr:site-specific integrase [Puia sp.]HVU97311.1 site-specific integrase [Puia sp.]